MTTQTRQKELIDKSMQCLVLARTINDRYPDITKIPAEHAVKVKQLLTEAKRLKGLADLAHEQDEMESWAADPGQVPAALSAEGAVAQKVGSDAGAQFSELAQRREKELFAKALRLGVKGQQWVDTLETAEKAAIIEDATGEIIVPHDIAGPIFKTLPHLGTFRGANPTVRPTTSNKVDQIGRASCRERV